MERRLPAAVELVGIALSPAPGEAYYLPLGHRAWGQERQLNLPLALERLQPLLSDTRKAKTAHNGKEIINALVEYGVKVLNSRV
jgi:DNA polymerase-1